MDDSRQRKFKRETAKDCLVGEEDVTFATFRSNVQTTTISWPPPFLVLELT
jgi:hypothetical protein